MCIYCYIFLPVHLPVHPSRPHPHLFTIQRFHLHYRSFPIFVENEGDDDDIDSVDSEEKARYTRANSFAGKKIEDAALLR